MESSSHGRRYAWKAGLVLLLGLAATAAVTWRLAEIIRASDEDRFRNSVANAQDAITDRIDTYMALLRAGASYIAAQRDVTREEFHDYVARLDVTAAYPGIQGIGWSERIAPEELADRVAAAREDGVDDFRVWPDEERNEYHAIVFLEPLDRRNQAAIGYDMFTDPTRRAAMEEARDTGLPRATGKVTLVQEIDERKQAGFLIYMPVYEGDGVPATVADRREKLRGFVYSPFRADDLLAGVFAKEGRPHVDFTVYDGAAEPDSRLHQSAAQGEGRFQTSETLDIAGRPWTIRYQTRPEFEIASWRQFVPVAFAVGAV
ncbi:MAG TPA: CHASE domain-containing protein, partial [Lacipirellula sp.]